MDVVSAILGVALCARLLQVVFLIRWRSWERH